MVVHHFDSDLRTQIKSLNLKFNGVFYDFYKCFMAVIKFWCGEFFDEYVTLVVWVANASSKIFDFTTMNNDANTDAVILPDKQKKQIIIKK